MCTDEEYQSEILFADDLQNINILYYILNQFGLNILHILGFSQNLISDETLQCIIVWVPYTTLCSSIANFNPFDATGGCGHPKLDSTSYLFQENIAECQIL